MIRLEGLGLKQAARKWQSRAGSFAAAFLFAIALNLCLGGAGIAAASVFREPVIVYGARIFYVGGSSQAETQRRSAMIERRIEALAANSSVSADSIHATVEGSAATIRAGGETLFIVSGADAAAVERPLPDAANAAATAVAQAVNNYRSDRSPGRIAIHGAISLLALLLLVVSAIAAWRFIGWLISSIYRRLARDPVRDVSPTVKGVLQPLVEVAISFIRLARLVTVGLIAYAGVSFILRQFPLTRNLSLTLVGPFVAAIGGFFTGFVAWLPQFAIIILIAFVAYEASVFLRMLRVEMLAGRIRLRGFEPDWIDPTHRLLAFFVLVLAIMAILPHLPGFDSPSFKAVGLVLSALVTFGSATTVANIIGGIVLTYTPSFRTGDYVKIGDAEGEVVGKSLFVTQIRSLKNVVIAMPNSAVITSQIFNYSTSPLREGQPLILHSTVTLGYDIPWRDINAALKAAALKTSHILSDPAPFVRQVALNDYSVGYEINAYTVEPLLIGRTYSELHENIQDECNARSIEILSPAYQAIRDGNQTTIPQSYRQLDYRAPSFRVEQIKSTEELGI